MEVLNKVEYRLMYVEDDSVEVKYFDSEEEAWDYIKDQNIYGFSIIKEELIASRVDAES